MFHRRPTDDRCGVRQPPWNANRAHQTFDVKGRQSIGRFLPVFGEKGDSLEQ